MMIKQIYALSGASGSYTWNELLWRLISFLVIFAFIIIIAHIVAKFIGGRSILRSEGKNLRIVDRISLGLDKSLYIVSVGECLYLIAMTKQGIELIDKLDKARLNITISDKREAPTKILHKKFDSYLDKYFAKPNKEVDIHTTENEQTIALKNRIRGMKEDYKTIKEKTKKTNKDEKK